MKAKRVKGADPGAPFAENAARILRVRLAELRSFAAAATDRDASKQQHDMRIAAKRLRYVLEVTGFCFGRPAEAARKHAKELQELLGEMHDVDVMLPRLRDHRRVMRDEDAGAVRSSAGDAADIDPQLAGRAPHRTAYRGLEVTEVYMLARRDLLFERFVKFWGKAEKKGVWSGLEAAVEAELKAAAKRRAAAERADRARAELAEAERVRQAAERTAEQASATLAEAAEQARRR